MFQWVKRQLDEMGSPTLDWVQVEVTTDCNAACVYCPHTIMKNRWANKHMPIELFYDLIPYLRHTDLVYLQGWGEPLLNNDFFEMIRVCKDRGKRVGFTTNGMLLGENTIRRLVDLELDIVAVSLAGTTAGTHDRFRKGTDFSKLISSLERLCKIKAEKKTRLPAVHLAYLMLRSNFRELQEIVSLAKRVGAKQIVASNLTLIVDSKLFPEAIFNDAGRTNDYRVALEEINDRAARENIVFDYHGPGLDDASMHCRENVRRACVISVGGDVVPCVLTNPVLCENRDLGDNKTGRYIFKDQALRLTAMAFGNIGNESLTRIWNKEEYARFRDLFDPEIAIRPKQIGPELPECCMNCYKRLGA